MRNAVIGLLLATALVLQGCMTEPELKMDFTSYTPDQLNDGWEITTPEAVGIDGEAMGEVFRDFHNDEDVWQVRSLTVYRHGKLIGESYTKDEEDQVRPRAVWSCTKQFIGVLTGIAVDRGLIESVDDPISKYLPAETAKYPDKADITIRELLTMNSGIDYDNYGIGGDDSKILQQEPDNYLGFVLGKPLYTEPGSDYQYKDSDPQILSSIIQKVTGRKTDEWADEVLFSKIGFDNYRWLRYKDGVTLGSFGMMTTPRELAKLAQLVLNGGTWNGQRIVSEAWLETMTAPLMNAGEKGFGYLWWSYPEHGTYFMSGNGRQLAFVFPASDLLVVITSETNVQGKFNLNTGVGRNYAQRIEDAIR